MPEISLLIDATEQEMRKPKEREEEGILFRTGEEAYFKDAGCCGERRGLSYGCFVGMGGEKAQFGVLRLSRIRKKQLLWLQKRI